MYQGSGQRGKIQQQITKSTPDILESKLTSSRTTAHTGSGTTQKTRNFANNPSTRVPSLVQLKLSYRSDDSTFKVRKLAAWNPIAPKYDAGHKNGRQNGGPGNDVTNIFAQNPVVNRFNNAAAAKQTKERDWGSTKVSTWRGMEDKINRKTVKYGEVRVQFKALEFHGAKKVARNGPGAKGSAAINFGSLPNRSKKIQKTSYSGPMTRFRSGASGT